MSSNNIDYKNVNDIDKQNSFNDSQRLDFSVFNRDIEYLNNELNNNDMILNNPNDSDENISKNVLKYHNFVSADDFDKYLISKQQQLLNKKSELASKQAIKDKEMDKFYNLSLYQISNNTTQTLISILNELIIFNNNNNKTLGKFINIFIKNDRLIYVGITTIIISFMIYFISATS